MTLTSDRPVRTAPGGFLRSLRSASRDDPRVAIVHPGALSADVYIPIARAIEGPVQVDVLDLQAVPELLGRTGPGLTIDTLAARLVSAAELDQGTPPLVLVGWSFGGVLAHGVVVLDSIAPVDGHKPEVDDLAPSTLIDWCYRYLEAKRGVQFPPDLRPTNLPDLLQVCTEHGALPSDTTIAGLRKVYETYVDGLRRNADFTRTYTPAPVHTPIIAIRAAHSLVEQEGSLGYDRLTTGGCRTVVGPGSHYSLLTNPTSVALIADVVSGALAGTGD